MATSKEGRHLAICVVQPSYTDTPCCDLSSFRKGSGPWISIDPRAWDLTLLCRSRTGIPRIQLLNPEGPAWIAIMELKAQKPHMAWLLGTQLNNDAVSGPSGQLPFSHACSLDHQRYGEASLTASGNDRSTNASSCLRLKSPKLQPPIPDVPNGECWNSYCRPQPSLSGHLICCEAPQTEHSSGYRGTGARCVRCSCALLN